ncbi:MFS transporter, partial [Arthrobacter deserti]|nr:MFS transporter [Arthrobacter deserti]
MTASSATSTGPAPDAAPAQDPQAPGPAAGRFRQLPLLAGRSFLPLGFLARLPLAMITIGALTAVTAATGSYAAGGAAAGAVGIGAAAGAPVQGHLADRAGQRSVLLAAAAAHTVAIAAFLAVVGTVAGSAGAFAAAVAASLAVGLTCPQVGSLARVRWMALTDGNRGARDTALSYEGTADELTFVLGPALVGLLSAFAAPWLPFVLAAVLAITTVPAFAVHPSHRAVRRPARPRPQAR